MSGLRRVMLTSVLALSAGSACDNNRAVAPGPAPVALPPHPGGPIAGAPGEAHATHAPTGAIPGGDKMHAGPLPPGHPTTGALPPGHPTTPGAPGANHPPMGAMGGMGGMAGGADVTPGDIPFDPKSVIAGELRVADAVKAKVAAGDVIFLTVRNADKPGPPLAVKRLTVGTWPLRFSLDGRDAMTTGTQLGGKVTVNVRVDKDGDALSKNPGDVTGVSKPFEPPSEKVVVTLDTVL